LIFPRHRAPGLLEFFEMGRHLANTAAAAATVLGLFQIAGDLTRVSVLSDVGLTFAMSPAPNPYNHVSRTDGPAFGCEGAAGVVAWHRWDHRVRGAIAGPHRRNATLLAYFLRLDGFIATHGKDPRMAMLTQYYFCNGGPIARAAGCPDDIRAVEFPVSKTWTERIACLK
jgi:hypothetical protein